MKTQNFITYMTFYEVKLNFFMESRLFMKCAINGSTPGQKRGTL